MQEAEELCAKLCPKDCVYMAYIDGGWTPICYYAVIMRKCRGCRISECDKYKAGKPLKPRIRDEYVIYWEREIYGEDADLIW